MAVCSTCMHARACMHGWYAADGWRIADVCMQACMHMCMWCSAWDSCVAVWVRHVRTHIQGSLGICLGLLCCHLGSPHARSKHHAWGAPAGLVSATRTHVHHTWGNTSTSAWDSCIAVRGERLCDSCAMHTQHAPHMGGAPVWLVGSPWVVDHACMCTTGMHTCTCNIHMWMACSHMHILVHARTYSQKSHSMWVLHACPPRTVPHNGGITRLKHNVIPLK